MNRFVFVWMVLVPNFALARVGPVVELSDRLSFEGEVPGERADDAPWDVLGDPAIAELVGDALRVNGDLSAAVHRIEQADALALQQLAPNLPALSASVGANAGPGTILGQPTIPGFEFPTTVWSGSALVLANWTFDLAGQRVLAFQAGISDTVASAQDCDQFAVSLGVQVTEAYLDIAAAEAQLTVLERQLGLGSDLLASIDRRYTTGGTTAAAVLQQKRQVAALESSIASSRATLEVARSRLDVLLGRLPGQEPVVVAALPPVPGVPPTGRPADLPAARPDLRAATARYQGAIRRRLAAGAAFAPSFGLNAQGGILWRQEDDDDPITLENWGFGLSLNIPVLNAGTIAGARQNRAAELASRDTLRQQVLAAVGEVEQGLAQRTRLAQQLEATERGLATSRSAFEVSEERFAAGLDDYLTLLTSWNSLLADELSAITVRRSLLGSDVRLRASLGGSWTRRLAGDAR